MSATYSTRDYEFAHGQKPRGLAHWALVPADYIWRGGTMPPDAIFWHYGTYAEAKRAARRAYPQIPTWSVMS